MRKLFLPLIAVLLLAASCTEEGDTYIYDGAYVYVEYPEVKGSYWQYDEERVAGTNYTTPCLYYEYNNEHINQSMIDNSFVMAYYVDEYSNDVALPYNFIYTDASGNPHTATISYKVSLGTVKLIVESADDTYDALQYFLIGMPMNFKICMMVND
ncbi:MAG: hypothetical protein IJ844_09290 [Prevotella sp.]|nr:hypothetical protein [Prevotella sp.]